MDVGCQGKQIIHGRAWWILEAEWQFQAHLKLKPFGKTVCVYVCVCEGIFSYRHCTRGGCKGPGNISSFPTPVCKLLQWSWKCLKVPNPSVQTFLLEAGNVSRFPTPVCNLFQWMLEMSQGSTPQCAIFFSGCWKFSSFPTQVCKLFQWMLEMSRASQPQCANFFSGCWKCLKVPHPSVQTFSAAVGVWSGTQPPLHKELRCSCSNYLVCFSCGFCSSQIHED